MKIWHILCLATAMGSSAMALDLPWWVQRVDVTHSGVGGRGAITLSGQWRDGCIPDAIGHRQVGNEVQLEITQPGLNTVCTLATAPWSLTEEFGPLDSPRFSIFGSLVSVDPRDRNNRQTLAGPNLLATIAPPRRVEFQGLGSLNSGAYVSAAYDTSGNGRTVVGHNQLAPNAAGFIVSEAFAWTPSTRMFPLGILPGGIPGGSTALGTSVDGNTVVGKSTSSGFERAFTWTLGGGMQAIPPVVRETFGSADAASWNGDVVVGSERFAGPMPAVVGGVTQTNAFRWVRGVGNQYLGQLYPEGDSWASDVSINGNRIVGTAKPNPFLPTLSFAPTNDDRSQAFLWTEQTGMVGLGHLPSQRVDALPTPSIFESTAAAISANGKFVVGSSNEYFPSLNQQLVAARGYIWSSDTGMQDLGLLQNGWTRRVEAIDVSGDGQLVVGMAQVKHGPEDSAAPEQVLPVLWQRGKGLRPLTDVLREMNVDSVVAGWNLQTVSAISADGTTIVGTGVNPQGEQEAWRLVFDWPRYSPAATLGDINGDGLIDGADAAALFNAWGKGSNSADLTLDGIVDGADAATMLKHWTHHSDVETMGRLQLAIVSNVPEPSGLTPIWVTLWAGRMLTKRQLLSSRN